MASQPLFPKQIDILIQSVTLAALQLPATAFDQVRVDWQVDGQPGQDVEEDIVYFRCVEIDDPYNRIRDFHYAEDVSDETQLLESTTYTRAWSIHWLVYGPNSFDRMRQLKSAMFRPDTRTVLANQNLYIVPDTTAPQRAPEVVNGQWWERVDWEANFYEAVIEQETVNAVASVEVIVDTDIEKVHPTLDFFVPPSAAPTPIFPVPTADLTVGAPGQFASNNSAISVQGEITAIAITLPMFGQLGTVDLELSLGSGDFINGGSFLDGGSITVVTPGFQTSYQGQTSGVIWQLVNLAGGTHEYTISGNFSGPQGNGAFVLRTANLGTGLWTGSAAMLSGSIHYN